MPAPVSSTAARTTTKSTTAKLRPPPQNKKTRVVRRRGRAKDAIGSDDEIEREIGTDSDSEDDGSSLDSATDSDTEPTSEHVAPNGHSRILTRNTTQSPEEPSDVTSKPPARVDDVTPFFGGAGNWSEMVADENVNGPADLPVIDFADLDGHTINQHPSTLRSRKAPKAEKKSPMSRTAPVPASTPSTPSITDEANGDLPDDDQPVASSSRQPFDSTKRAVGQTARQVYQQRLETDPSYVPTVGEFWGHDDRLLDKDLRSLSGWWRGRWQGHGRGRGGFDRGFHMRGRGRGAYFGTQPPIATNQDAPESDGHDGDIPSGSSEVAPIERAWTHDGFEEMKRRDEHHRNQQQPQQFQGFVGFRGGRGGFSPSPSRGRGAFSRGRFAPSPTRGRANLPFVPPAGRPWFAMKPERMWTKQHDAFLYFDPALKPRPGQGPGFRVQLPGDRVQIIRAPPRSAPTKQLAAKLSTASVYGSEDEGKAFVVRIPKWVNRVKVVGDPSIPARTTAQESVTTVDEAPINDVFTVRPRLVERNDILPASTSTVNEPGTSHLDPSNHVESAIPPAQQQLSLEPNVQAPNQIRRALTEEAVLRNPLQPEERSNDQPDASTDVPRPSLPILPPLQTAFSPIVGNSPSYGSPYGYGQPLPPGIAMSQHGMPYEVATGRAVYLQPPPPPPMYNPRPIVHSHMAPPGVPFVPGHMHSHSTASPDFLSQPPSHTHTPPINGFIDPSTGTPIFTPPRQSSRIEIRAPSEQPEGKSQGKLSVRKPSGLRSAAAMFEPSRSASETESQGYFPVTNAETSHSYVPTRDEGGLGEDDHGTQHQQLLDPAIMSYSPYQQPYYYPEPYGYAGYMDMSQVAQYEMYPPDPRVSQAATVYY